MENDGTPNLSNIVITYNHLRNVPLVEIGDTVQVGERLGITGGDWDNDHLHLEVYIAQGFGSNSSYLRINPFLLYSRELFAQHNLLFVPEQRRIRPYYPTQWTRNLFTEDNSIGELDRRSDREQLAQNGSVICQSICLGIVRGDLGRFTLGGEFASNGGNQNFWRAQVNSQPRMIEWTNSMLETSTLITYLNSVFGSTPFSYPNCTSENGEITCPDDDLAEGLP
jgi:murein DD-endopeptidase MepM/ murein hydrolase activator NlpD